MSKENIKILYKINNSNMVVENIQNWCIIKTDHEVKRGLVEQ